MEPENVFVGGGSKVHRLSLANRRYTVCGIDTTGRVHPARGLVADGDPNCRQCLTPIEKARARTARQNEREARTARANNAAAKIERLFGVPVRVGMAGHTLVLTLADAEKLAAQQ